ncbi:hypothetical protein OAH33_00405 [bacterium]|nr:hypothetical protein [bacterium]
MKEETDKIISNIFSNNSSYSNIVFASLLYRLKIEKRCLQLSVSLDQIPLKSYFLICSIRNLFNFLDLIGFVILGLFKKRHLDLKVVNKLKDNNVVVFEQKERNLILKDKIPNHGLIYLSYAIQKTKYSKYTLRLGLKGYLKVVGLKIKHFQVKTSFLIKYVNLDKGFRLFHQSLVDGKKYKFFSQEGFVYDHRLFIKFFKLRKFRTFIFFSNINYNVKIPQLSDHIIIRSEKSKKWIHDTDLSKVIVLNDSSIKKEQRKPSAKKIRIAYLPELNDESKDGTKTSFLISCLLYLESATGREIQVVVRDHPQVYDIRKKASYFFDNISPKINFFYDKHEEVFVDFIAGFDFCFSSYYSTGLEDSALMGIPSFVIEYSDENSIRYNVISSELIQAVKVDGKFEKHLLTEKLIDKNLSSNHNRVIEDLFDKSKKITIESALNI